MRPNLRRLLSATTVLAAVFWAHAENSFSATVPDSTPTPALTTPTPLSTPTPIAYEQIGVLDASQILQPDFYQGPNFKVRDSVPISFGANHFTIDSDFGVFEADGNALLMRRVAEINAIAKLKTVSQSKEFTDAAKSAAKAPLHFAQDLANDPVATLSSVPQGVFGFLNRAKEAVTNAVDGNDNNNSDDNAVEDLSGFAKMKRDIAIKLGVDPYTTNETFQEELSKVVWPAFLGKFTVSLGMAAIGGPALSVTNLSINLANSIRDKSPAQLRRMNSDLLQNNMGVSADTTENFLDNNTFTPAMQTILVDALAQLGNISGQAAFIREAAGSQNEHDALAYQRVAQLMVAIGKKSAITRIAHLNGLTLCRTIDGSLIVPVEWDYAAWTPAVDSFLTNLKAQKFATPVSGYAVYLTGAASPAALDAAKARAIEVTTKALPGPLK